MADTKWELTANRFVAFFDIMGFKDLVDRNSHSAILSKLTKLKIALNELETADKIPELTDKLEIGITRSITFSDSIVIFSESDTAKDANKILVDSTWLIDTAIGLGLGIKGALSHGEVTVDFEKAIFFGRPIIDAYLLHDQLYLYSTIIDNNFERRLKQLNINKHISASIFPYNTNLKCGRVYHKLVCPPSQNSINTLIENVEKMYDTVSGSPRTYIDNTLSFLKEIEKQVKTT